MVWVLSGPSSAGKSTFIESPHFTRITSIQPDQKHLLFPRDFSAASKLRDTSVLHFNILRKSKRVKTDIPEHERISFPPYSQDLFWQIFKAKYKTDMTVIVLVCSRETLLERTRNRNVIEANMLSTHYPSAFWQHVYKSLDLKAVYERWIAELEANNIDYICLDSSDTDFRQIDFKVQDNLVA